MTVTDAPEEIITEAPPSSEPVVESAGETGSSTPADRRRRFPGRLVVVLVLVGLLFAVGVDVLVGRLSYNVRQDHLAAAYNDTSVQVPELGGPVLNLQVESPAINVIVASGADAGTLRGAPALVTGSALPGETGNVVILGRSTRFAGPFGALADVADGTEIMVRTRSGRVARYEVTGTKTVNGDDLEPMEATEDPTLTLVTSSGGPFDSRRRIVSAELVGLSAPDAVATGEASGDEADPEASAEAGGEGTNSEASTEAAGGDASGDEGNSELSGSKPVADFVPGELPEQWDVRSPGSFLVLLAGLAAIVLGALAVSGLRRDHPMSTVIVAAGPAIALGVVLVLFNLDALLPATY